MSEVEYDQELKSCVHVIEDDDGFRDALIMVLEGAGHEVYGHCDADSFLDASSDASSTEAPHCIISDVVMPGMSGVELQTMLASTVPEIPVILITAHGDIETAVEATKAGAFNFIAKPFDNDKLLEVVDAAVEEAMINLSDIEVRQDARGLLNSLTRRQREIFDMMAVGKTSKIIAHELDIALKTVEVHRSTIKQKLKTRGLENVIELSRRATTTQ